MSRRRASGGIGLIVALFVSSRLMLLMAFPPENLIAYGDYQQYYNVAELSARGFYPYIDFWYEFPPVFPYLNIIVYELAGGRLQNYILLLAFVLLLFEVGNLYLIYRLALSLYGPERAITTAWIYTALFVPLFFWLGNFDAMTTFFILLGLYALVKGRSALLVFAMGVGAMVKILPLALAATVWRARDWRAAVVHGAGAVAIGLLGLLPFLWLSPTLTLVSLQSQAGKSSYETVWALIDGNYTTGNFGPLADRFDPAKAVEPINNPARIPTWLTLLPFAGLGLFILFRPRRLDVPQDAVVFTALMFIIFFLWSQGWSPQWQTFLIPLVLLSFNERRGVLYIIVLGFINFLEWPVMLSRGLNQYLPLTIIPRTLVFILMGVELYQILQGRRGDS